jgi:type IV pilus assembly protein PilA
MMRSIRNRKGFTLVELMIVVAIIGILAAIAIPNFLNFRLKAKAAEAKSNLGAIRSTEIAFFAEWNSYIGAQSSTQADPGKVAVAFPQNSNFSILGFAPEGKVYYGYGLEGTKYDTVGFTAHAYGDLDGDNQNADYQVNNTDSAITKSGAPF